MYQAAYGDGVVTPASKLAFIHSLALFGTVAFVGAHESDPHTSGLFYIDAAFCRDCDRKHRAKAKQLSYRWLLQSSKNQICREH